MVPKRRGRAAGPGRRRDSAVDVEQFRLHAYMEDRHWWFLGRRRIFRALVSRLLPASPATRVLDLGCGTGANAAAFSTDYTAVGIDPAPGAIALARRRFPDLEFHVGKVRDAGDRIERADLVLLTDVIEHVEDDERLLGTVLARARPGTHLLLTVPAHPELWSEHDVALGHHRRYTPEAFRRLWSDAEVETLLVSYFNTRLYPVARLFRLVHRWRGAAGGAGGTDLELPPPPVNRLLARIFGGEAKRLVRALRGTSAPYGTGLSLLAVLRRSRP